MTPTELMQLISKVRRDMPHNKVVLSLCTAAEQLVAAAEVKVEKPRLTRAEIQRNYRLRKKGGL